MQMFKTELCNGEGHYCYDATGYLVPNCTFFIQIETVADSTIHFYVNKPVEIQWGDNKWEAHPGGVIIGTQVSSVTSAPIEVRSNEQVTELYFGNKASDETDILSISILRANYITDANHMCYNLKSLVSFGWYGTNSVISFESSWENCCKLENFHELDISSALTLKQAWKRCERLKKMPGMYSNTVLSVEEAWYHCHDISEYGNIILESCENWRRTFAYNLNLQVMSYIDSSEGTEFSEMFAYDRQLACIEAVDTLKYKNTYNMFLGCVYLVEPNAAQQILILNGYEWTTGEECSDAPSCGGDTCLNFRVWDADAGMYAFENFITLGNLQYQVGRTYMGCGDGTQPDYDFGLQCTPDVDCPDCITFNVYYGTGNLFDKFDVRETSIKSGYYYYADPNYNNEEGITDRVVVMDPLNMAMVHDIPTITQDPSSADRAGFTSRMYLSTKASHYFDVMDTASMTVIKSVDLMHHEPNSAGAYNKYRNMQLISGKDNPMVSVIRVDDDSVITTVGEIVSGGISGNCGTDATGSCNWLDKDHFTLVDRYNDKISVYKVSGEHCLETIEKTQDFIVPTACHTIDIDVADLSLSKTVFYAEIEGSAPYDAIDKPYGKDVRPQVWKLFFNSGTGELSQVGNPIFFDGVESDDMIHHYNINPEGTELWQPVCADAKVHVIDLATMAVTKVHEAGLGAGHVNFSTQLNLAIITNHFCQFVDIIDRDTDLNKRVYVNGDSEIIGLFTQSHFNHVSPDGLFFYIFATESGDFIEIDLTTKIVSRIVHTGGTPEQSTS